MSDDNKQERKKAKSSKEKSFYASFGEINQHTFGQINPIGLSFPSLSGSELAGRNETSEIPRKTDIKRPFPIRTDVRPVTKFEKLFLNAIKSNNLDMAYELLALIDLNRPLQNGDPPLWIAALNTDPSIFECLLTEQPSNPRATNRLGRTLSTQIALYSPWKPQEKYTYLMGIYKQSFPGTADHLIHAALGHLHKLKQIRKSTLIQKDVRGRNALIYAAANGQTKTVEWLLKEYETTMKPRDFSFDIVSALFWSVKNRHLETTRFLLKKGNGLKIRDGSGMTLLMWAAHNGDLKMLQLLIKAAGTIQVYTKDEFGMNAVLHAANNGQLSVMEYLITECFATIRGDKDDCHMTALLLAARNGHLETAKWLLIENHADIDEQDIDGNTAVMLAARGGHEALAKMLISEFGANPNGKNKDGKTIHSMVQENPDIEPDSILKNQKALDALYQGYLAKNGLSGATDFFKVESVSVDLNRAIPHAPPNSPQNLGSLAPVEPTLASK